MNKETREDKSIHERLRMQEQNKRLSEMSDDEFAAEFDKLTDADAKKAIEKMQEKQEKGE